MNNEFVGHLNTYDKKGEGEQIMNDNVLLEITEVTDDGCVELAFTDRNERVYVKFNLGELTQHVLTHAGSKSE